MLPPWRDTNEVPRVLDRAYGWPLPVLHMRLEKFGEVECIMTPDELAVTQQALGTMGMTTGKQYFIHEDRMHYAIRSNPWTIVRNDGSETY